MIDGSEEHKLKFLGSCDIVRHYDSQLGPLCKKKAYCMEWFSSTLYTGHACYSLYKSAIYWKVIFSFLYRIIIVLHLIYLILIHPLLGTVPENSERGGQKKLWWECSLAPYPLVHMNIFGSMRLQMIVGYIKKKSKKWGDVVPSPS